MARERMSFSDYMTKDLSGLTAGRFKSLKEKGSIVTFLHTVSGITPRLHHLIPYVAEGDKGGKLVVRYFPFVCHEDYEAYVNGVTPTHCPLDRFIDWLAQQTDIDDNEIVWEASIGDSRKDRIATKADLLGTSDNWQGNLLKPRQQVIYAGVDVEYLEGGLLVGVESRMIGDAIKAVVKQQIDSEGEENGDPSLNPYAFKLKYNDKAAKPADFYEAYPFKRAKLTPEISELLAQAPVDISKYLLPGNIDKIREIMDAHIKIEIDLDQFFNDVLPGAASFDPEELEAEAEVASVPATRSVKKASPLEETAPTGEPCDTCDGTGKVGKKGMECPDCDGTGMIASEELSSDDAPQRIECDTCDGTGKFGKKGNPCPDCDGTGFIEVEADDDADSEPEVEPVQCDTCGGTGKIGKKGNPCPDCDGTGELTHVEPEPEPEPKTKPKSQKATPAKPAKGGKKGGKKSKEEAPSNLNTKCGGCQKMIPDNVDVCPFCGAIFV